MTTRDQLITGALDAIRTHGIAGVSARTVAAAAGVNQALVFYHFGSVDELLTTACRVEVEKRVEYYRERFAAVRSLRELLELGRALHVEEREEGNVTVLAQLLAGAQVDEKLRPPVAVAVGLWAAEVEKTLRRILEGSPLQDIADPKSLASAVCASFIGLQMYEAVDPAGTNAALDTLAHLGALVEMVDNLGPVARRAVRRSTRRAAGKA